MKRIVRSARYLLFALFLLSASGCTLKSSEVPELKGPVAINSVRAKVPDIDVRTIAITRSRLKEALKNPQSSRLRLIELLKSAEAGSSEVPEYRLFDVYPETAAAAVGLQTTDILVAAHGYVIYNPLQFWSYLNRLQVEKEGSIEIRRENQPIEFKISIVD